MFREANLLPQHNPSPQSGPSDQHGACAIHRFDTFLKPPVVLAPASLLLDGGPDRVGGRCQDAHANQSPPLVESLTAVSLATVESAMDDIDTIPTACAPPVRATATRRIHRLLVPAAVAAAAAVLGGGSAWMLAFGAQQRPHHAASGGNPLAPMVNAKLPEPLPPALAPAEAAAPPAPGPAEAATLDVAAEPEQVDDGDRAKRPSALATVRNKLKKSGTMRLTATRGHHADGVQADPAKAHRSRLPKARAGRLSLADF
jgi:hypothetical protein